MPRTLQQHFQIVAIESLTPHPDNPRRGNKVALAESIEANGFYAPVVVQQLTGYILVGNHRWQAAKDDGAKKIPALFVDVNNDVARRILLADNRTSDLATNDEAKLLDLMEEIMHDTGSLTGTGYYHRDLDRLLAQFADSAAQPDKEGSGKTKARCYKCPGCGHRFERE